MFFFVENKISDFHVSWDVIESINKIFYCHNEKKNKEEQLLFSGSLKEERKLFFFNEKKTGHLEIKKILRERRSVVEYEKKKMKKKDFLSVFSIFNEISSKKLFPLDELNWKPIVTFFVIYVIRVEEMESGYYIYFLDESVIEETQNFYQKKGEKFTKIDINIPLYHIERDTNKFQMMLSSSGASCGQHRYASFTLGMVAKLEENLLEKFGCDYYLNLHWECGIIGQFLYILATSIGYGACGMGCFLETRSFKDFSLEGSPFSTFYHLSVGHSGAQYYHPYDYSSEVFTTN